jgi:hypothetical protein
LAESLLEETYEEIIIAFGRYNIGFSLFTVAPAACVQGSFDEVFSNDVIVFAEHEQAFVHEGKVLASPSDCCYIMSPGQPSYAICHYCNSSGENGRLRLERFAQDMSRLSWLSVRSGRGDRVLSLPPHIAALIRKVSLKTALLTRFAFLPAA